MTEIEIPQWKKDLIARLRSQNKRTASSTNHQQLFNGTNSHQITSLVQQPAAYSRVKCDSGEMVEKCEDSDEDLHYGPGIVNKLKERYLSLAQREKIVRPTILRKATSLENILDDDLSSQNRNTTTTTTEPNRLFQTNQNKNLPNRYNKIRTELKRARSVETISINNNEEKERKRESLNEDMLIRENDKFIKINRPKRLAPLLNDKEKPPVDVVRQAKMIFERKPEQRTKPPQQTGEVAAKIANFKNIIVQNKKPTLKIKPKLNGIKTKKIDIKAPSPEIIRTPSPIKKIQDLDVEIPKLFENFILPSPDISRVDENQTNLSETPDLIITSSPILQSPTFRKTATENFLKEEIRSTNENNLDKKLSITEPLNLIINGTNDDNISTNSNSNEIPSCKPVLTTLEIEKNLKNTVKSLVEVKSVKKSDVTTTSSTNNSKVPKVKKPPPISDSNTVVFKFIDRKDVPDHVPNDGLKRVAVPEKPKVGEGGIIWIPGASLDSSTDEDQEIMRSLECPPSPCDVVFVNDNILIDGKSSIRQKTKKIKLKISFVDEGPEVYEYPSESSLLIEESPTSPIRNSTPLSGLSSLANYTPKSTEDFQPGVTRSIAPIIPKPEVSSELNVEEVEKPITFSAGGANSDILF